MSNFVNGFFPGEIYPSEVVAGCVHIYENLWPNPEETIHYLEEECSKPDSSLNWTRAETLDAGALQDKRTNFNLFLTEAAQNYENPLAQNIHNQFYIVLLASLIPYARQFGISHMYHEGYNVLKYSTGQYYDRHSDGDTSTGRSISAILYLNDDYEGGEIEFVNFGVKIKPEPGMLVLFPSNYAYSHIAHPVTSGTKYSIVTWIKDREI